MNRDTNLNGRGKMGRLTPAAVALLAVLLAATSLAWAQAETQKAFYEGKRLRVLVWAAPGGGFDTYARVIARHIGRHLPGNPPTIVQNMPGGGGLIMTNYLYNVAKRDGLTIAHMPHHTVTGEMFLPTGVKYKSKDFVWLGSVTSTVNPIVVRSGAPVKTLEKLLDSSAPQLFVGAVSREGALNLGPKLVNYALKAERFKIIPGYAGTSIIRAAMHRGEVDGMAFGWTWDSIKATGLPDIESGAFKVLGYWGERKEPELDKLGVPFMPDIITDPEAQALLRLALAPSTLMMRPWAAPPGTPQHQAGLLRNAFRKTMEDPKFLADAGRMKVEVNPIWHEELETKVAELLKSPPELVAKIRELLKE